METDVADLLHGTLKPMQVLSQQELPVMFVGLDAFEEDERDWYRHRRRATLV